MYFACSDVVSAGAKNDSMNCQESCDSGSMFHRSLNVVVRTVLRMEDFGTKMLEYAVQQLALLLWTCLPITVLG